MRELIQKLVDNGLTVVSISRATGIENSCLSKWLKGGRTISAEKEEILRNWLKEYKAFVEETII